MEHFKNLLALKKEEEENLKKEIEKRRGKGFVLVHPFWMWKDVSLKEGMHLGKNNEYVKKLGNLIKKKEPLIILEEPADIAYTVKEINKFNGGGKIYVVPTDLDTGAILHKWEPLIEKMKELGIRKIHLGGRTLGFTSQQEVDRSILARLGFGKRILKTTDIERRERAKALKEYEDKWITARYKKSNQVPSRGCVGNVYYNLVKSGEFEIVRLMPNLCSPEKRREAQWR